MDVLNEITALVFYISIVLNMEFEGIDIAWFCPFAVLPDIWPEILNCHTSYGWILNDNPVTSTNEELVVLNVEDKYDCCVWFK